MKTVLALLSLLLLVTLTACSNMNSAAKDPSPTSTQVATSTSKSTQPAGSTTPSLTKKAEAPIKTESFNEKLLGLIKNLPSTQWFFDDGKQAELG